MKTHYSDDVYLFLKFLTGCPLCILAAGGLSIQIVALFSISQIIIWIVRISNRASLEILSAYKHYFR